MKHSDKSEIRTIYVYYATDTNELFLSNQKIPKHWDAYSDLIGEL